MWALGIPNVCFELFQVSKIQIFTEESLQQAVSIIDSQSSYLRIMHAIVPMELDLSFC